MSFEVWTPDPNLRPYELDPNEWIDPTTNLPGTYHDKAAYEINNKLARISEYVHSNTLLPIALGGSDELDLFDTKLQEVSNCHNSLHSKVQNSYISTTNNMHKRYMSTCASNTLPIPESMTTVTDALSILSDGYILAPLWNIANDLLNFVSQLDWFNVNFSLSNFDTIFSKLDLFKAKCNEQHSRFDDLTGNLEALNSLIDTANSALSSVASLVSCGSQMLNNINKLSPALMQNNSIMHEAQKALTKTQDVLPKNVSQNELLNEAKTRTVANLNIDSDMNDTINRCHSIIDVIKSEIT